jgi:hypothetical protein
MRPAPLTVLSLVFTDDGGPKSAHRTAKGAGLDCQREGVQNECGGAGRRGVAGGVGWGSKLRATGRFPGRAAQARAERNGGSGRGGWGGTRASAAGTMERLMAPTISRSCPTRPKTRTTRKTRRIRSALSGLRRGGHARGARRQGHVHAASPQGQGCGSRRAPAGAGAPCGGGEVGRGGGGAGEELGRTGGRAEAVGGAAALRIAEEGRICGVWARRGLCRRLAKALALTATSVWPETESAGWGLAVRTRKLEG